MDQSRRILGNLLALDGSAKAKNLSIRLLAAVESLGWRTWACSGQEVTCRTFRISLELPVASSENPL